MRTQPGSDSSSVASVQLAASQAAPAARGVTERMELAIGETGPAVPFARPAHAGVSRVVYGEVVPKQCSAGSKHAGDFVGHKARTLSSRIEVNITEATTRRKAPSGQGRAIAFPTRRSAIGSAFGPRPRAVRFRSHANRFPERPN